jgi:hypothetical protein
MIKTILSAAAMTLLLSSGAAYASCYCHHHHHVARAYQGYQGYPMESFYAAHGYSGPQEMGNYHSPFGTYDVEPSPVTDQ